MKKIILFIILIEVISLTSCKKIEKREETNSSKPNILLIVADDLGFSDIGCYGGNINTPVINTLSKESMIFSNFHVQPTCSPSRSSLLTGCDNHVAGLGIMSEMDYPELHNLKQLGYSGSLSKQVLTIPEILHDNAYHTYMVGKWHLGEEAGQNPFDRGFEETFILGTGGGSHNNDKKALSPLQTMTYTRNGREVKLPEDFYSTRNYTDSIIKFIDNNKADNKPFFAYQSYTAVHDPLQAPKEYIEKYKGKFDTGWDFLWQLRFNNLKALGLIPKSLNQFSKNPSIPNWNKLPKEKREEFARDMEVYAAMLDYMDMSIGRILTYLKKEGKYDNTMIIFLSDNGANGALATTYPGNADHKYLSTFNNSMENKGLKGSYVETGAGWAQASTSPFRFFKSFVTEGGIKAPLIVKMPSKTKKQGQWNNTFLHVTDIMPTILELTGVTYPEQYKGEKITNKVIGKSIISVLNGKTTNIHSEGMGWELFEMKAYIKGNYKILRLPVPFGTGDWQLYNILKDPCEANDISIQFPEIKTNLIKNWNKYAKDNDLYDHKGHFDTIYRASFTPGNGKDRN